MTLPTKEITDLLAEWTAGSTEAEERLLRIIYPRLKAIAANRLQQSSGSLPLQTTELVHEAFLKLIGQRQTEWANRSQFFALTARLMRRILVDNQRRQQASKRGGGAIYLPLDEASLRGAEPRLDWLLIDRGLTELGAIDPLAERVVELRHFAGLEVTEVTEVLKVSRATVIRKWRFARAWLKQHLEPRP